MNIINNRPRIYECEGVKLMPGPNEIPDADAKKFLGHKAVKQRIVIGHLTIVEAPKAAKKSATDPVKPATDDVKPSMPAGK